MCLDIDFFDDEALILREWVFVSYSAAPRNSSLAFYLTIAGYARFWIEYRLQARLAANAINKKHGLRHIHPWQ